MHMFIIVGFLFFLCTSTASSFNPEYLLPIPATHTHIDACTLWHTHKNTSTRQRAVSAQEAASAARPADVALIIGCDRCADIISKRSPAREQRRRHWSAVWVCCRAFPLVRVVVSLCTMWTQLSASHQKCVCLRNSFSLSGVLVKGASVGFLWIGVHKDPLC